MRIEIKGTKIGKEWVRQIDLDSAERSYSSLKNLWDNIRLKYLIGVTKFKVTIETEEKK